MVFPKLRGEGLRGDLQPGLSLLLTFGSHGLYYDELLIPITLVSSKYFFFLNKNKDFQIFPEAFNSTIKVTMWFMTFNVYFSVVLPSLICVC